jgi:Holliday junction DNA helicase RuvB
VISAATIDKQIAHRALTSLEIDEYGLDRLDREIIAVIGERYRGGPVGIETLAITLGEESATIEEVYEPFLVYQGFLSRGPRGRSLTDEGKLLLAKQRGCSNDGGPA